MNNESQYSLAWLSLDEACEYTGRSRAAIKRWVAAGKIEKMLVPLPGARPRVRLLRRDLERVLRPVSSPIEVEQRQKLLQLAIIERGPLPHSCDICGADDKLVIDHCHRSNSIRGHLCNRCNTTLGRVEDNIGLLNKMVAYLDNSARRIESGSAGQTTALEVVSETRAEPEKAEQTEPNTALVPAEGDPLNGLVPILEKLGEWLSRPEIELKRPPEIDLKDRLTWTLAEARTMTGLSRPMLRDLAEAHPEIVLRRGRRLWFMAARLREVLG